MLALNMRLSPTALSVDKRRAQHLLSKSEYFFVTALCSTRCGLREALSWPCIFRAPGLPDGWGRPGHLVCLSSALLKCCSSGCGFQIMFLQDLMAPRRLCEILLVSALLCLFFSFSLSKPSPRNGRVRLTAVSRAEFSHSTLAVTCTTGSKVNMQL